MSEEISKILKMIEEGKLTAEQGKQLIDALGSKKGSSGETVSEDTAGSVKKKARTVCIYVSDGDKKEVEVRIPKGLVSCIGKYIPKGMSGKVADEDINIDLSELMKDLENCECGDIISVNKEGKKVRICCE